MENDSHSNDCYITSFKEEDDCIALSSNIRVDTIPKTESDNTSKERKGKNKIIYNITIAIAYST